MAKSKRNPISYTPKFGGGIFRPKDVIAQDLATVKEQPGAADQPRPYPEQTDERSNKRPDDRLRVRHSFDVFQDQLLALTDIQVSMFKKTGRKPKLGELVQEALDGFIDRHT